MLECWKAVYGGAKVDSRDRIFFPFSFGPFLGFWTAFEAGCQIGAHCIPAGGMSSQARLSHDRHAAADRRLLHADLRASTARGCRRDARRRAGPVRDVSARADRGGRGGRQHPVDARADRAGLGRARHRSSRAHRSRSDQLRVLGGSRRAPSERSRIHLRGSRARLGSTDRRRRARRARRDEPRTMPPAR